MMGDLYHMTDHNAMIPNGITMLPESVRSATGPDCFAVQDIPVNNIFTRKTDLEDDEVL